MLPDTAAALALKHQLHVLQAPAGTHLLGCKAVGLQLRHCRWQQAWRLLAFAGMGVRMHPPPWVQRQLAGGAEAGRWGSALPRGQGLHCPEQQHPGPATGCLTGARRSCSLLQVPSLGQSGRAAAWCRHLAHQPAHLVMGQEGSDAPLTAAAMSAAQPEALQPVPKLSLALCMDAFLAQSWPLGWQLELHPLLQAGQGTQVDIVTAHAELLPPAPLRREWVQQ